MIQTAGNNAVRRRSVLRYAFLVIALAAVFLASCSSDLPQSSLNPKSVEAESIDKLWDFIIWLGKGVYVGGGSALAFAIGRVR